METPRDSEFSKPGEERDAFDALLSQAEWPEPSPVSLARLERRWEQHAPRRSPRRRIVAAAAGIMVAAGAWWGIRFFDPPALQQPLVKQQQNDVDRENPGEVIVSEIPSQAKSTTPIRPEKPSLAQSQPRSPIAAPRPVVVTSREPTLRERMLFVAIEREERRTATERQMSLLENSLARLTGGQEVAEGELKSLRNNRDFFEPRIRKLIQTEQGTRRQAAIRLLGDVGTPDTLPFLLKLAQSEEHQRTTIRSIAKIADSLTLARMAALRGDETARLSLWAALLARGDTDSVSLFIDAVQDPATRRSALAGLTTMREPPVEQLFLFLNSPRQAERLAAAHALGQLCDSEVSQQLIRIARTSPERQEAFVALLSCTDSKAGAFLDYARHDPLFHSVLHAAELQRRAAFSN